MLGLFYDFNMHVKLVTCIRSIKEYYHFEMDFNFRFVILTAIDTTYPVDLRQCIDHGSAD